VAYNLFVNAVPLNIFKAAIAFVSVLLLGPRLPSSLLACLCLTLTLHNHERVIAASILDYGDISSVKEDIDELYSQKYVA
jgi:hypothetical protein